MTAEMSIRRSLLVPLPDVHPRSVRFPGGTWASPSPSSLLAAVETPSPVVKTDRTLAGFLMGTSCLVLPSLPSFEPLRRSHCMFFSANTKATKASSVTLKADALLQSPDSRDWGFLKTKCTGICNTTLRPGKASHWP